MTDSFGQRREQSKDSEESYNDALARVSTWPLHVYFWLEIVARRVFCGVEGCK